jgi:hypothetical protein
VAHRADVAAGVDNRLHEKRDLGLSHYADVLQRGTRRQQGVGTPPANGEEYR